MAENSSFLNLNNDSIIKIPSDTSPSGYIECSLGDLLSAIGNDGRIAITLNDKNNYEGIDKFDKELALDGDFIGIFKKNVDGVIEFVSKSKELSDRLDQLDSAGLFENIYSVVENQTIRKFVVDNVKKIVQFPKDVVYPKEYRYYRIRDLGIDEDTDTINYLTEIVNGDTSINLVDMRQETNPNTNIIYCVPENGKIKETIQGNKTYLVEFLSANLELLDRKEFFSILGFNQGSYLDTPSAGIVDVIFVSSRTINIGNKPGLYFYQGENAGDALDIRFLVKYTDDSIKDITNEKYPIGNENANLVLNGLDTINTSIVTKDEHGHYISNQSISATYTITETNDPNGKVSIPITIDVYIKENPFAEIESIWPVYTMDSLDTNTKFTKKVFGIYKKDNMFSILDISEDNKIVIEKDVDSYNDYINRTPGAGVSPIPDVEISIPQFISGSETSHRHIEKFKLGFSTTFSTGGRVKPEISRVESYPGEPLSPPSVQDFCLILEVNTSSSNEIHNARIAPSEYTSIGISTLMSRFSKEYDFNNSGTKTTHSPSLFRIWDMDIKTCFNTQATPVQIENLTGFVLNQNPNFITPSLNSNNILWLELLKKIPMNNDEITIVFAVIPLYVTQTSSPITIVQ